MRALVCKAYGPPDSLVIEERDDPAPDPGQVLVDVAAAGINFPDVLSIAGKYQVKAPLPFIPGNEAAGTVTAIGEGVSRYAVGDKVIAATRGSAFAEKCVADEVTTMPLPQQLDFEQGAGFAVTYSTSYHALKQSANLQPDETVLVLGAAGGVGITAVEIAKAMGARVIAAASSDEKLEFASSAGADELINYSTQPLKDSVKELTAGNGVDVVYDPVGGDFAQQALRATAWHGRYLVIGEHPAAVVARRPADVQDVRGGAGQVIVRDIFLVQRGPVDDELGAAVLPPVLVELLPEHHVPVVRAHRVHDSHRDDVLYVEDCHPVA